VQRGDEMMKIGKWIVAIATVVVVSMPVVAQTNNPMDHQITVLNEFVRAMEYGVWMDQTDRLLELGSKSPSKNQASEGLKNGMIDYAESSKVKSSISSSYPYTAKAIDIVLLPSSVKERRAVRGMFQVTLPQLKRIQLELDFDLIQDDPNEPNTADFYVEVYEQSPQSANGWVKSEEFHEKPEKKTHELQCVLKIKNNNSMSDEKFTSHSYIANLTKFAGREVLVTLTAETYKVDQKFCRGRWMQARLVGSTFDYKITPITEDSAESQK